MKKANLFAAMLSVAVITSCSTDMENSFIDLSNKTGLPVTSWGINKSELKSKVSEDFAISQESDNEIIYESTGETEILQAYRFDSDGELEASLVMMPEGVRYDSEIKDVLKRFEKRGKKNDILVYSNETIGCTATVQTINPSAAKPYDVYGFAKYEPTGVVDSNAPYVDLGLSVCWAKCNVGAKQPEDSGDFFAWAETRTKSSYWRENYDFCTTDNGYVFTYFNSVNEISGTKYDAATKVCGDDWRMPTKEEANELIYYCTWKATAINGIAGYEVTGPNGNSIFIPKTSYKYQDDRVGSKQQIWTGSGVSKTNSEAYVIKFPTAATDRKPVLDSYWKAWGHAIRPVYDPK